MASLQNKKLTEWMEETTIKREGMKWIGVKVGVNGDGYKRKEIKTCQR